MAVGEAGRRNQPAPIQAAGLRTVSKKQARTAREFLEVVTSGDEQGI